MIKLPEYTRKKEWLVCVDSDGCAMDTMDIKHIRCFGPCMVAEWGLEQWQEEILYRWNEVNLYTMTRGINRFKGLAMALQEVNEKYRPIEEVEKLAYWAEHSDELSNDALKREIEAQPDCGIFKKALSWSNAVNTAIRALPESEIKPYEGVKEALAFAQRMLPSYPAPTPAQFWRSGRSTGFWSIRISSLPRMPAARPSASESF